MKSNSYKFPMILKKNAIAAILCTAIVAIGTEPEITKYPVRIDKMTGFDRKDSVENIRIFHLNCPEINRPFKGYFAINVPYDIRIQWSDGFRSFLKMTPRALSFRRAANKYHKPPLPAKKITFSNACLDLRGFPLHRVYLKPNLDLLDDDVFAKFDSSRFAGKQIQLVQLCIKREKDGLSFYFDGSYAGTLRRNGAFPTLLMLVAHGGERFIDVSKTLKEIPGFAKIDLSMRSRNDLTGKVRLNQDLPVPMQISPKSALDLRNSTGCGRIVNLYHNRDLTRSAFDALPMSYLFSVPAQQYSHAWVLCAPIPSQDKPAFRLAVTRYAKYGRANESISFTEADLSKKSNYVLRVGSAELKIEGKKVEVPLYLVKLPIRNNNLQDIIFDDSNSILPFLDYLDIDLQSIEGRSPDLKKKASVAVFGITLEKAPVRMLVKQKERANVFHTDEKAVIPVELAASCPGDYELSWSISDINGKKIGKYRRKLSLKDDENLTLEIPVKIPDVGWYKIEIHLAEMGKTPFINYDASAVILHPDTRKAGYESPYATWWFGTGVHNGYNTAPAMILPFLKKAGIRSVCAHDYSEEAFKKWGVTLSQIPFLGRYIFSDSRIIKDDPELWKKMEEDFKYAVGSIAKRFPHCTQAVILHESYRGQYPFKPAVMTGKKPEKYSEQREKLEKARIKAVETMCRVYRKNFPHIKIVFGNSTWAQGIVEAFAARGFDSSLIDFIGSEAPGGKRLPESFNSTWTTAGSAYVLRETARLSGWNKPVTGCYEWVCRSSNHGKLLQAQLIVRDILTAHAFGFSRIAVCGAADPGTAYNQDPGYGAVSFCTRQYQPKPVYAAVAVATRILDRVKFKRAVPVSDLSVLAFDFKRADGKNVYVLWTPENNAAECELQFSGNKTGKITSEDIFGRRNEIALHNGTCKVRATKSARYFVTDQQLQNVKVISMDHPLVKNEPEKPLKQILPEKTQFTVDMTHNKRFDVYKKSPFTTGGIFCEPEFNIPVKLSNVRDDSKGMCLSVKFDVSSLPDTAWIRGGYTKLVPKIPFEIPAGTNWIGMQVKGNWSRGRLIWEITDGFGRKYLSNGDPHNGAFLLNDYYQNQFNYNGWRFLSMPLNADCAIPEKRYFGMQWCGPNGRSGNAMRRPFKITGIILSTTAKADHVFETVPVTNQELRLGKIFFYK